MADSGSQPRAGALHALPLGHVRPEGWLRRQLELQASGMAGHLDEFWPDVADSAWIGGSAEGWERAPYWLDGVVPLSRLLGDIRLKRKVRRWIDHIIEHQDDDGWMGPHDPDRKSPDGPYDVWPRMVLLKALLQYHESTGERRVLSAATALCRRIHAVLTEWPLHDWGRARWADLVYCLDQLYERTGDVELMATARLAHEQGLDWAAYAEEFPFREKVTDEILQKFRADAGGTWMNDRYLSSHGVNVAMGLRALPVWSRHGDSQRAQFTQLLARLDQYHGQAHGMFSADEHLAGTHPAQGTETCAIVEFLFSLATALEVWGPDEAVIERWERVAFNALPASARPNEWGHQYDQQTNQVICHVTEDRPYTNNGPDANIFGLEPHFGCCTANRHQGWPKFAARLWMRAGDGGLTALSYAPCTVDTIIEGRKVHVEVTGEYPFGTTVELSVTAEPGPEFPLHLRIPAWADAPTVTVDGESRPVGPGSMHSVTGDWSGEHRLRLDFPAPLRTRRRSYGSVTVSRGPLVFAV
ncbi:MAG TPA: beta-L-arabinofuranosidase domain-containing protein, partial [Mycobacteriales bacterium]|nr:beta-L-arabinofuranosidase domain-containing protein [Mycobacteriales bacterium]